LSEKKSALDIEKQSLIYIGGVMNFLGVKGLSTGTESQNIHPVRESSPTGPFLILGFSQKLN